MKQRTEVSKNLGQQEEQRRERARMMCPECHGERYVERDANDEDAGFMSCPRCDAFGHVPSESSSTGEDK